MHMGFVFDGGSETTTGSTPMCIMGSLRRVGYNIYRQSLLCTVVQEQKKKKSSWNYVRNSLKLMVKITIVLSLNIFG